MTGFHSYYCCYTAFKRKIWKKWEAAVTKAWRFAQTVLFITYTGTPSGRRKNEGRRSLERAKRWGDCWPWGRTTGLQSKHKNDGYEGMAHSFRQPYFRRWLPGRLQRLQQTLLPSTSVVSQLVYVHTDTQYLHQPLAQAPISSVLLWRCQEKYWLCLWWNVIVVSLSGRIRKSRVMRQDGRWWRRRKVPLMGGICQRTQGGGLKCARLGWIAKGRWRRVEVEWNLPKSGTFKTLTLRLRWKYSVLLPASAATSPVACRHMRRMAICLFSFCRMSKSRRRKIGGRDKVTGVMFRVVFLEIISHKIFFKTHYSRCSKVRAENTTKMWSV